MVNFVLEQLESVATLDLSGAITSASITDISANARGVYYLTKTQAKAIFKFQTDSFDVSNNPTSDIKYSIDYSAFTGLGLNPANAMMDTGASSNPIASVDANGVALDKNKMLVAHDFIRHIAKDLFGTHLGVDLFNNETELIKSVRSVCSDATSNDVMYKINQTVKDVSTTSTATIGGLEGSAGSKYMTNANTTNANLCRVLFNQMIGAAPSRFASVQGTQNFQSLPFEVEDSINFKLTLSPASGQKLLTRTAADAEVADRSYEIRLLVVEDSDAVRVNTTPSNDEL
jgi:hypothetical protein